MSGRHDLPPACSYDVARELDRQPLLRMQRFGELLSWNGLQLFGHRLPDEYGGYVVIFYTTGDSKFNLWINARPHRQLRLFEATVHATRYGIRQAPWQPFELFDDDSCLLAEADRLRPLLARRNFKTPAWRRRFATEHPQLVLAEHRRGKW